MSQNSADTVLLSTDGQLYLPTTNLTVAQINFFDKDSKPSDLRIKLATRNMIVAEDGIYTPMRKLQAIITDTHWWRTHRTLEGALLLK